MDESASMTVAAIARAARAKANALRTDPSWRKRFAHPLIHAFALDHFASDLETAVWTDWLPKESLRDEGPFEFANGFDDEGGL